MTKKNETHWLLWKRVLLEKGAFGNGCFWKWLNWKMVVWKGVLLVKDELENGAFGKWTFGKGCSWKRMRKNEK